VHKCNAHALFLGEMLKDNQDQPVDIAVISIIIIFYFPRAEIAIEKNMIIFILQYLLKEISYQFEHKMIYSGVLTQNLFA